MVEKISDVGSAAQKKKELFENHEKLPFFGVYTDDVHSERFNSLSLPPPSDDGKGHNERKGKKRN